jgi:4-amino-4-deoxy-L-arabinose transferase-like glycosyltransferase
MSRASSRAFWLLIGVLLLITRVPAAAQYLSIDNVNLAFALDNFDPRAHQPQPPGYPFFVAFAKVFNLIFRDPETTFLVISVLVSALCLPVLYALAARMFDDWTARAAVCLFLVNPVFWHSGLDGPLRVTLALFSLLSAYCAWRAWAGEKSFVYWGALALGVGSGFRPGLLLYLGPIWLVSAFVGTRSLKTILSAGSLLTFVVLIWGGGLAYAVGGPSELYNLLAGYLVEQSTESVVMGASGQSGLRQLSRLVIWNGLAVVGWIWAVPFFFMYRDRAALFGRHFVFWNIWLVPGLLFQALIHVAAPGHTLFSIPAFCLIGAYVLKTGLQRWQASDTGLVFGAVTSVLLFLNFVPLPPPGSPGGIRDAFAVATFESSLENIRWLDNIHGSSLTEIRKLSETDREIVIIAQDMVQQANWFLNWRIARYYLPDSDIRVFASHKKPAETAAVRGSTLGSPRTGTPVDVAVPNRSRILWLVESGGPLHAALAATGSIHGGQRIFYTDIDESGTPFQVMDFRILPTTTGVARDGVQ